LNWIARQVKAGKFKDRNQLISEALTQLVQKGLTAYFIGIKSQSPNPKTTTACLTTSFSLFPAFSLFGGGNGKIGTMGNGQKNLKKWKFVLVIELD